jgi:hypothetical protein
MSLSAVLVPLLSVFVWTFIVVRIAGSLGPRQEPKPGSITALVYDLVGKAEVALAIIAVGAFAAGFSWVASECSEGRCSGAGNDAWMLPFFLAAPGIWGIWRLVRLVARRPH